MREINFDETNVDSPVSRPGRKGQRNKRPDLSNQSALIIKPNSAQESFIQNGDVTQKPRSGSGESRGRVANGGSGMGMSDAEELLKRLKEL